MGDGVGPSIYCVQMCPTSTLKPFLRLPPYHSLAEATAVSAKKALLAVDNKPDANPSNAERDFDKLWERKGYTLPIPIREISHVDEDADTVLLRTFHVKPQDWLKYWMDTSPETLGGCHNDPAENYSAFWTMYREVHPEHEIFQHHASRLHQVCPLLVHGDEGRAVKRTNFMVVSIESPLGNSVDDRLGKGCACQAELDKRRSIPAFDPCGESPAIDPEVLRVCQQQQTNFKGHSYMSRWLIFGLGKWVYSKHPQIIEVLFKELSENLSELFHHGVQLSNGSTCYAACLGLKGDMDFHSKSMNLERCYSRAGTKNQYQICHLCMAGDAAHPFECYDEEPSWMQTLYQARPWNEEAAPSLSTIPFSPWPEQMMKGDLFHIVKLGIGRSLVGGVLVVLLRLKFFDHGDCSTSLPNRFTRAHSHFSMWCKATKHYPGLRSFSMPFFGMKNLLSAPTSNTKGSDTVLCLKWLSFVLKCELDVPTVQGHSKLLSQMLQVVEACLGINLTYHHGLWMNRSCARLLYTHCMTLLRGYSLLGEKALALRIRAFIQRPKGHALHHVAVDLKRQLQSGLPLVLSPQIYSCDISEDFLGRISRLSRRVGFRQVHKRVITRYFLKVCALYRQRKAAGCKSFLSPKRC